MSLCTQAPPKDKHFIFLGTIMVKVFGGNIKIIEARAILDNASPPNLISEKICKILDIKPSTKHIQVSGIGSGEESQRPNLFKYK